jgi:hypothetical protein
MDSELGFFFGAYLLEGHAVKRAQDRQSDSHVAVIIATTCLSDRIVRLIGALGRSPSRTTTGSTGWESAGAQQVHSHHQHDPRGARGEHVWRAEPELRSHSSSSAASFRKGLGFAQRGRLCCVERQ